MKYQKRIEINKFQLNLLLNEEQKEIYNRILNENVFCKTCLGVCSEGVKVNKIFLDSLNDIVINGTCKVCNDKVSRVMEFGENQSFYNKANDFRQSIS